MAALPEKQERQAQPYAAIAAEIRLDELGAVLPELWPEVAGYLSQCPADVAGAPFIRYVKIDMEGVCKLEVGIPCTAEIPGSGRVVNGVLPGGRYAVAVHEGPFDALPESNATLQTWVSDQGLEFDVHANVWAARLESYLTDPEQAPDSATWLTELAYKLRDI